MSINFPTTPADGTIHPNLPVQSGVAYVYKSTEKVWRDMRGRANRENKFTNPALQISQINNMTDGSNVVGLLLADEWIVNYLTNVGVYRGQLVASPTPRGGTTRARISITTADTTLTAGEWLEFGHSVEASKMVEARFGSASAKQLIVRFGWKSPAGTFNFAIRGGSGTPVRSFISPFTITAGQANTDVEVVILVPGDTTVSATNWATDNTRWARFEWVIANANTTSSGNANKWIAGNFNSISGITNGFGTVGNTFELFDVGLYVDPNLTGLAPEWELPDVAEELRRCQRYMCKVFGMRGLGQPSSCLRMHARLPVTMRVAPALALRGNVTVYDGVGAVSVTSLGTNYSTRYAASCDYTVPASSLGNGRAASQYWNDDNSYIWASAYL